MTIETGRREKVNLKVMSYIVRALLFSSDLSGVAYSTSQRPLSGKSNPSVISTAILLTICFMRKITSVTGSGRRFRSLVVMNERACDGKYALLWNLFKTLDEYNTGTSFMGDRQGRH